MFLLREQGHGRLPGEGEMNEKLKPCVCGAAVKVVDDQQGYYHIVCDSCYDTTKGYESRAKLIKAWNGGKLK